MEKVAGHRFDIYFQWLAITFATTLTTCPAASVPAGLTEDGSLLAFRSSDHPGAKSRCWPRPTNSIG